MYTYEKGAMKFPKVRGGSMTFGPLSKEHQNLSRRLPLTQGVILSSRRVCQFFFPIDLMSLRLAVCCLTPS